MAEPSRVFIHIMLVVLMALSLAGCELIGDIFQAGMAVGAIAVILVLVLIGWLVAKARG